ncbi:MAG: nitrate/nitrite transporter [Pirellulaceae bacterium]
MTDQTDVAAEGTLQNPMQRALTMFSLVLAGEAIFGLPFHVSRYFRPTYVDVFDITQTQLGLLGSIYGFVAMFAYLLGGGLADRFSPRGLLTCSLLVTGASGLYMATIPSFAAMCVLFAFWGASTILPFWSALIRATREWGGREQQGVAFGVLDGGRGLLAALLAMLALYLFSLLLPDGGVSATPEQKKTALRSTIFVYTSICAVAAASVWLFLPATKPVASAPSRRTGRSGYLMTVLAMPAVWLQAIVIIAAYCTFKGIDYYSQYASDVWGWSDVRSAGLSAFSSWMRPIAAIGAGILADRMSSSRVIIGCFVLTGAAYISFGFTTPAEVTIGLLWANVLISCLGLFALRGIYFALLEESEVPSHTTGTAVGVVSFIGYTPDVFMPLVCGWLIDRWSGGATGYNILFAFLGLMSIVGISATVILRRLHSSARQSVERHQ